MLRQIKTSLWNARLIPIKCTGLDSPVLDVPANVATISRSSAGVYVITLTQPFAYARILGVPSCITAGKRAVPATAASTSAITIQTFTASSGAAADAEFYVFLVGQDSTQVAHKKRPHGFLYSHHPRCRLLALTVDDDGSVLAGARDFTVTEVGSGVYTATIRTPGCSEPIVVGSGFGATTTGLNLTVTATTNNTITFGVEDSGGTGSADGFSAFVFIYDTTPDVQSGGRRHPILTTQLETEFLAYGFTTSDSGATITYNYGEQLGADFTGSSAGIGKLAFDTSDVAHGGVYGRTPVGVATVLGAAEKHILIRKSVTDYSAIGWRATNASGAPEDNEMNLFCLAYGSASET